MLNNVPTPGGVTCAASTAGATEAGLGMNQRVISSAERAKPLRGFVKDQRMKERATSTAMKHTARMPIFFRFSAT